MKLILHPRIRLDLREIIEQYDRNSDRAGDRFIEEFNVALDLIEENPERFHFITPELRRCNLKHFPYHLVYEVRGSLIRVPVVRHHRRHPDYGLRRRW